MILGLTLYLTSSNYQSYNILNVGDREEIGKTDVFFYMNPVLLYNLPITPYNIIYTLIGLFFHNGRFLVYALIIQYRFKIGENAKQYGLILTFLWLYALLTKY